LSYPTISEAAIVTGAVRPFEPVGNGVTAASRTVAVGEGLEPCRRGLALAEGEGVSSGEADGVSSGDAEADSEGEAACSGDSPAVAAGDSSGVSEGVGELLGEGVADGRGDDFGLGFGELLVLAVGAGECFLVPLDEVFFFLCGVGAGVGVPTKKRFILPRTVSSAACDTLAPSASTTRRAMTSRFIEYVFVRLQAPAALPCSCAYRPPNFPPGNSR
jgi:hypothetical protein